MLFIAVNALHWFNPFVWFMKSMADQDMELACDEMGDNKNWKPASLMTVLACMAEKGAVYCDRTTRTNYYSALVSEEEYKLTEGTTFLEKPFHKSAKEFVASLYQGKKMSSKDIQELREYLDTLEREEG